MEKSDFSRISTFAELQEARAKLHEEIVIKEAELEKRRMEMAEFYSPENLLVTALRSSSSKFNWVPFALSVIRSLKSRLQG